MKNKAIKILIVTAMGVFLTAGLSACAGKADAGSAEAASESPAATEAEAASVEEAVSDEALPAGGESTEEVPYRDEGIKYMGGLATNEAGVDMKLAFFRKDGDPIGVLWDGTDFHYGNYETEDTQFDDGTKFVLIDFDGKKYGYWINDDMSGFLVDNDDNKFNASELDEGTAMELLDAVGMADEGLSFDSFVEDQSGITEFKDYDDIIAHLTSGQGYAYIKLDGSDDEVLLITKEVFDADNTAYEADLYGMSEGKPVYMSIVTGNGSAYPLRYADGILYAGDNHRYESYFIFPESKGLMMKDSVTDGINEGTGEYVGFLRKTPDYDHDENFTGGEKEFQALLSERESKPVIKFTKIS